jgi:hypothetical protein
MGKGTARQRARYPVYPTASVLNDEYKVGDGNTVSMCEIHRGPSAGFYVDVWNKMYSNVSHKVYGPDQKEAALAEFNKYRVQ